MVGSVIPPLSCGEPFSSCFLSVMGHVTEIHLEILIESPSLTMDLRVMGNTKCRLVPIALTNSFQKRLINNVSLSDTMTSNVPCSL